MIRRKIILEVIVVLGFLAAQIPAFGADLTGLYLGGNFGRARNEYDTAIADRALQDAADQSGDALVLSSRSTRRLAHVWWGDVGYYFTPNLGVEAEYLHLGGMQYLSAGILTINGADQGISTGQELTSRGPALSLIGRFPITQWFELRAQAGDYVGKSVLNENLTTPSFQSSTTSSKTTSGLLAGAGVALNIGGHWSIRADFLHVNKTGGGDIGKFSVNLVTGGVSFTF